MFKKAIFVSSFLVCLMFFGSMGECFAAAPEQLAQADVHWKNGNVSQAEAVYKAVVTDYPGTDYALEAQKKLVMLYKHEPSQAEAALQKLVSDFSAHGLLAESIYEIAEHHRENKSYRQFEAASQFYQYLAEHWPASPYGMRGQSGLALSSIAAGSETAAQAAIDKLFSDYSEYEGIAKAVYDVAHWYNLYWKYEEAKQLYQRVINNWSQTKREMWVQVDLAHSNIVNGNDTAAQTAIDELVAKISEEEFVAGALYDIAEHYQRLEKHARAKQVYQYVIDNRPGDYYGVWSQMGVVVSNIHLGNEAGVQVAFDKLVADFSGHEHLSDAVFYIADNYDRLKKYEKARQYYQYVLDHWPTHEHHGIWTRVHIARMNIALGEKEAGEAMIDEWVGKLNAGDPLYSYWPAVAGEAYIFAGECYHELGKYEKSIQCYQTVVDDYPEHRRAWHALSMVGGNYESLIESGRISESKADVKIKDAYEQILAKHPGCPAAELAQRWLNEHNPK